MCKYCYSNESAIYAKGLLGSRDNAMVRALPVLAAMWNGVDSGQVLYAG